MPRKKLQKILAVGELPNVLNLSAEPDQGLLTDFFGNTNGVTLEVGCGRGDYSRRLAQMFPGRNFVGVDVKGARLWAAAKMATESGAHNVAFLRIDAHRLTEYFSAGSVEEIWIPFPDPFPKKRGVKRRLTSPVFLERYAGVLKKGGQVHLKTDHEAFWQFTMETLAEQKLKVLESTDDLYASDIEGPARSIQTRYEESHLAKKKKILYVRFGFV